MPYKNIEDRIKRSKEYHEKNKEKIREYVKKWSRENREKCLEYARRKNRKRTLNGTNNRKYKERRETIVANRIRYEKRAAHKIKDTRLRQKHGVGLEWYNKTLNSQNNCCAICKLNFEIHRTPQVDHCHDTGKIRALLCRRCNMLEGFLKKKADLIELIYDYRKKYA